MSLMEHRPFKKIMVANRGEIACRIFAAAKVLGIKTVAVYSDADSEAMHVKSADEKILLGAGPAADSYINIDKIIRAAKDSGTEAIHPGYGFLSEREQFAKAVQDTGLVWIGPSPKVIELMGNKIAAKIAAEKANVPTLPWAQLKTGWNLSDLKSAAKKVGFPLLLKAAAGGGGRGMRLVDDESELEEKAQSAAREAQGAFGSSEVFLEKYCPVARHIEVQILGDSKGNVKIFGERDCSSQRRHQKVVEESPAINLSEKTRKILWSSAESLAKSVKYVNAGTLEFLMDPQENVYFLEMNTRLQVEHPVSELVWGVDLPVLQLKIAQGEELSKEILQATPRGHAMEVRIYAEDASKGFIPTPGKITDFYFPISSGMRIDTGYESGSEVPIYYDAMLAKVIAWGMNREEARIKILHTLEKSNVSGVAWNGFYLKDILNHQTFIDGKVTTHFLQSVMGGWKGTVKTEPRKIGESEMNNNQTKMISPWMYYGEAKHKIKKAHHRDSTDDIATNSDAVHYSGPLMAEYPGKVLKVNVKQGDQVEKDQVVVVCESMKMEFSYTAPAKTKVKSVKINPGEVIQAGKLMIEWED